MNGKARMMLRLKKGNLIAFAEKDEKQVLTDLRETDPRMKGGRITEVLQCYPGAVDKGVVVEQTVAWRN